MSKDIRDRERGGRAQVVIIDGDRERENAKAMEVKNK